MYLLVKANIDKIWSYYVSFPYKDPRNKYSTMEHKIAYRELLAESDWCNALVDYDIIDPDNKTKIKEKIATLVDDSESDTIFIH